MEWADEHRMLSSESSAEPGKWYTSRTPYMREPMEAVTNPDVETIVLMTSTQVGKTELCSNVIGYFIHQDPAPILMIEPTLEIAEAYSKDRLAPMLRDTPVLAGLVPEARSRKTGSTMLHKAFPGGHLTLGGSNSPSSLASRPIRILICDEVDRYEPTPEGHAVNLASKRTTNFWNRKKLFVSSPKFKKTSMIEAAFKASDQRYYHVPCWACKKLQKLEWAQVKFQDHDPKTALYVCSHCGAGWNDAQRYEAIMDGQWIAEAEFNGVAGFHLWEAYNPWIKLREIVAAFLAAHEKQKQGDNEPMKTFINTSLGETWEDAGETVAADPLLARRESYAADRLPYRILYLTAGVDVQDNRIECFDSETEVLTESGWIKFPDLNEQKRLATVRLDRDELEFQRPLRLISHHHEGRIVKIKSDTTDIAVTPNHRMVVSRTGRLKHWEIVTAGDLIQSMRIKAAVGNWAGNSPEAILLPKTTSLSRPGASGKSNIFWRYGKWHGRAMLKTVRTEKSFAALEEAEAWVNSFESLRKRRPALAINTIAFAKFVGLFLSEGHLGKYYSVCITQNIGPKADEIRKILSDLPFHINEWRDSRRCIFKIFSKMLSEWMLENCGQRDHDRKIPAILKGCSRDILQPLVDAMYLGDGWTQSQPGRKPQDLYATNSKQLAGDLQEVLIKLGHRSNVSRHEPKKPQHREMFYVSKLYSRAACLTTHRRMGPKTAPNFEMEEYTGQVYCATVPNGTLVCRRNGKMFVAGNCEVVGWRAEKRGQPEESWGVEVMVLHGDPAKPEIWDQLDEILKRDWTTEDGRRLKLGAVGVDSGGHFANEVYKFCSNKIGKKIYAVKGMSGIRPIWPPKGGKSKKYKGHAVWIVGVDTAKDAIYSRLRIKDIGPGYCHFPETESYGKEFFKQLTSEEIKTRFSKGHPIREWHKPAGVRNEALDRRAYALAALYSRAIPWEILARTAPSEPPAEQIDSDKPAAVALPAPAAQPPAQRPRGVRPVRFRIR